MLNLYVMRGPKGSGKSTFLSQAGLLPWTVSPDQLRQMYGSFAMSSNGVVALSHQHEDYVFAKLIEILEQRMRYGETTIVDATHSNSDYKRYLQLADKWGYALKCITMGEGMALDDLMSNVQKRAVNDPGSLVPKENIARTMRDLAEKQVPKEFAMLTPQQALAEINAGPIDLTGQYKNIVFVGDVQGCATPLRRLLDKHYSDDTLFVFVGDLFDRGPENGEVFQIMQELLKKPNVRLMCGNHERHIQTWINGLETPNEFRLNTLPQLFKSGFDRESALALRNRWEHLLQFQFNESMIQVTHGGAPAVIERPGLFGAHQCWRGVGEYNEDIDTVFEKTAPAPWFQVHGHRNSHQRDLKPGQRSFNLESSVEFGGELRALSFNGERFVPIHVSNKVFIPMANRNLAYDKLVPAWIKDVQANVASIENPETEGTLLMPESLDDLRNHPLVREMVQKDLPHVSSFNFTRDAFYQQSYDSCNTSARGLYVNTQSLEVVIRGYDKYFNVNERNIPSAKLSEVLKNTSPPYTTSIKENGYLGLVGYDRTTDALVCASKSTISGDHAVWVKERLYEQLSPTQLMNLKIMLRDCQMSLAFEVIEPERDPHIIEYRKPGLVLLDGIRRSLAFEKLSRAQLQVVADQFGFECRADGPRFQNKTSMAQFLVGVSKNGFKHNQKEIEGLVVEDANGHMVKLKLPYYSLWKACRSGMEAVVRQRETGRDIKAHHLVDPTVAAFIGWLQRKDPALAEGDIITARKAFLIDHPEYENASFDRFVIKHEVEESSMSL